MQYPTLILFKIPPHTPTINAGPVFEQKLISLSVSNLLIYPFSKRETELLVPKGKPKRDPDKKAIDETVGSPKSLEKGLPNIFCDIFVILKEKRSSLSTRKGKREGITLV